MMQALLLQRISELEAQLKRTAEAEQAKARQLARLEGRAAVAEGSLKAAEQQVSQALAELQEQRAKVGSVASTLVLHFRFWGIDGLGHGHVAR